MKVKPEDQHNPWVKVAEKVADASLARLHKQSFKATSRHGDFHQSNVLFVSGRAFLVDWGSFNCGDPMGELAYFAYHVDAPLSQLDSMLGKYGSVAGKEAMRAKSHLALTHAHRYLQTLRGMPWDLPEWREEKLQMHIQYLIEDSAWLALPENPTSQHNG